jgi:hypothetical protein
MDIGELVTILNLPHHGVGDFPRCFFWIDDIHERLQKTGYIAWKIVTIQVELTVASQLPFPGADWIYRRVDLRSEVFVVYFERAIFRVWGVHAENCSEYSSE